MIIKNFTTTHELESNELAECGILKYKRMIYLFVEPNAYQQNISRTARAVIINASVSKGSKEGNIIHIAIDNSVIIRFSVYFCDVIFEESNNIYLSQFTVKSAYSREIQSLFDQRQSTSFMLGMYSSSLGELEVSNAALFYDIMNNMDTSILPPLYYTEMHEYKATCDIFTMGGGVSEVYSGRELIDNKTAFKFMDINLWDTMRYAFLGVMSTVEHNSPATLDILNNFYSDLVDFIGEDCYFIYDSDGKGIDNPGTNIVEGNIPYKSFYIPKYIQENVTSALILFEQSCHDIERKYGHIRAQCYPNKIGNKIKIRFKDYDAKYPTDMPPLGNVEIDGATSASDHGFHVEKQIDEVLENFQDSNLF
jgi:hypothetical protein